MKSTLLIAFIFFAFIAGTAQEKDSLQAISYLKSAQENTYSNPEAGKAFSRKGIAIANLAGLKSVEARITNTLGLCQRNLSQYDSAQVTFNKAIALYQATNDYKGRGYANNNLAMNFYYLGDYETSHSILVNAIKEAENRKIYPVIAISYQNLGLINNTQERYTDALENFKQAANYYDLAGNPRGKTGAVNNMAYIYSKHLKQYDKALAMYKEVIPLKESFKDEKGIAICHNNMAEIYLLKKGIEKAQNNINKAIVINTKLGNKQGLCVSYLLAGKVYLARQQYSKAEDFANRSVMLAKEIGAKKDLSDGLSLLADTQSKNNNAVTAYESLVQATRIKDSILNKENFARMAELETKYETEKKERRILEQRNKIAEDQQHIYRQNRVIYITLVAMLIAILLGYILFNRQRVKNMQLRQDAEISAIKQEIETQNRLQEQRMLISRDLHDNIGAQLTFIISSLDNLKYKYKIADDGLQGRIHFIRNFTKETITELRDTIWAMSRNQITIADLKARIGNYIENAGTLAPETQFNFETDTGLNDEVTFSSLKGINIYRIIQECINNALKHSGATMITVKLAYTNALTVSVADNGIGFNSGQVSDGNGLVNINKRAQMHGGNVVISSGPQGTVITVTFNNNTATDL